MILLGFSEGGLAENYSTLIHGLCLLLGIFSWHRLLLVWLARRPPRLKPSRSADFRPEVLVQVPLFNEPSCCERVIDAVACLAYPRDRLAIQILDDSTDETVDLARARVSFWRRRGVRMEHLRRQRREGFKAGAMAAGLKKSDASLVAVFDADFLPKPNFLQRLVPFFRDEKVGTVQAKWGHINATESLLTRAQATLLDAHFRVEHRARNAMGWFFNFNGTAGIWRRKAIDDAGGWSADTVTEDLDLSLRAHQKGWLSRFVEDVSVPARLPGDFNGWRIQQRRWVCGGIQTARKHLGSLWPKERGWLSGGDKAGLLLQNFAYFPLAALVLLLPFQPFVSAGRPTSSFEQLSGGFLFLAVFLPTLLFFMAGTKADVPLPQKLCAALVALALSGSLVFNNVTGAAEGLLRASVPFRRTPKGRSEVERAVRHRLQDHVVTAFAGLYGFAVFHAACTGLWAMLPFLSLLAFGFCYAVWFRYRALRKITLKRFVWFGEKSRNTP